MDLPNDTFLVDQHVLDLPVQAISLDCNFWQGMDPYMEVPQEMTRYVPDLIDCGEFGQRLLEN